jgi:hypothetical protein
MHRLASGPVVIDVVNKAHILAEIKRTAAANGGTALGWRRFCSETGIKYGDWCGVYWARWNDAVREAGVSPNQRTKAYDESELLDAYARYAAELDRLPTGSDLRLKTQGNADFPNESTFGRLGTKLELATKLMSHCSNRPEFDQVLELASEYVAQHQSSELPTSREIVGYVYLVKSGRYFKIGRTASVGRREYELSLQLPDRAVTVHVIETDDPRGIETYWHARFARKRKNGEWFELEQHDINAFKRRKFM